MRHIKIIHGVAPAEDPVLGKKPQKNGQQDISTCQFAEGQQKAKEFFDRDFAGFTQCFLYDVIKPTKPVIDFYVDLHLIPSAEKN